MEGRPEIDHALAHALPCDFIFYTTHYIDEEDILSMLTAYDQKPRLFELSQALFDDLTYQHVPGNFLGVFQTFSAGIDQVDPKRDVLVLEQLEKPGNLGAILRTCDALGFEQVICTSSVIDLFNPNVLRNARGAVFSVQCAFTDNETLYAFLMEHQYIKYAAALHSEAKDYKGVDKAQTPKALLLGSESRGLSEFWLNRADQKIIIPMHGVVDSLNVSVSAAILLSHFSEKS